MPDRSLTPADKVQRRVARHTLQPHQELLGGSSERDGLPQKPPVVWLLLLPACVAITWALLLVALLGLQRVSVLEPELLCQWTWGCVCLCLCRIVLAAVRIKRQTPSARHIVLLGYGFWRFR